MTIKKQTTGLTESDFEASIHQVVGQVFPWIPNTSIRHQTRFSFKIGQKTIELDGKKNYSAIGIADIILFHKKVPLAVLELKRQGIALTVQDEEQGISYARMLSPSAPLVIVTNGRDTRIIATHTGKEWIPTETNEVSFANLIKSAALVASYDIKLAVETLLGTNSQVWQKAMHAVTKHKLEDLTCEWKDYRRPFVKDFLIPRVATIVAEKCLYAGNRLVLIEGPPLAGKSSVLREIALRASKVNGNGVLFIEFNSGRGIFDSLADTLENALGWSISQDDARRWLKRASNSNSVGVWLLIDGYVNIRDKRLKDIEDLTSNQFGNKLGVVVAIDDSVTEQLLRNENGRATSQLGRSATRISVGPLNEVEFEKAKEILENQRITFINGSQLTDEYRQPWMIRAIATTAIENLRTKDKKFSAALPPFQGLSLIEITRERFKEPKVRHQFDFLAKALLEEIEDTTRSPLLRLAGSSTFLIRDSTLDKHINNSMRDELILHGFIKHTILPDESTGVVIRLPELLACQMSNLIKIHVAKKANTPTLVATWLCNLANAMPLGDLIVARALFDSAMGITGNGLKFDVLNALLKMAPVENSDFGSGTKLLIQVSEGMPVELTITDKGAIVTTNNGKTTTLHRDEGEWLGKTYGHMHAWLILSHLAELPFCIEYQEKSYRFDLDILLTIGSASMVLRKNNSNSEPQALPIIEFGENSIVSSEVGIVETITFSILQFFMRDEDMVEQWIDEAISSNSPPLLYRINTALYQVSIMANQKLAIWATKTQATKINPALTALLRVA